MKTKNLALSGIALVLIVAVIIVTNILNARKPSTKSAQFLPGITENDISAIVIADSKDTAKVKRKGGGWVVELKTVSEEAAAASFVQEAAKAAAEGGKAPEGPPAADPVEYSADSASVATVLDKLVNMKKGELISSKPEKQELFEVDTAKGTLVKVFDAKNKPAGEFYIGKSGADWSSNFVRSAGSNKVYNVSGSIKYAFFTDKNRWRDKTITKFPKEQAKNVTLIKQGGNVYELERSADTTGNVVWKLLRPEKANAKKDEAEKVVSTLASFSTTEWETDPLPPAEMGFDQPELIVSVTLDNGETKTVTVGKKKEGKNQFWVKTPGKDAVFLVSEYNIERLDRKLEDLKEVAPADTAAKK
jgi:hypothetical protein